MLHNKNIFEKRVDRFKNPRFKKEEYEYFDFNNNFKSININELKFTNYLTSNLSNKYKRLTNIYKDIKDNNNNLNKNFIADEIDINIDIPKLNRLYNIISKANEKKIERSELILKFKNLEDKEIQFFIKKEQETLKLYLVDIYHLAIEAENRKTGRIDLNGIYAARKNSSYCISNIIN